MNLLIPVRIERGRAVPSSRFCRLLYTRQMSDGVWYFFNTSTNPDVPMLYAWPEKYIKELNPTMIDKAKTQPEPEAPQAEEAQDQPWPQISDDALRTLTWIMENNASTLTYNIGGGGTPAGVVDLLSDGYMERTDKAKIYKLTDVGERLWETLNKDLTGQRIAVRHAGQIVVVDVVKMLTVNTFTATTPVGNDELAMEYNRSQIIETVQPKELDAWLGAWSAAKRADDERHEREKQQRQREIETDRNEVFADALMKALTHLGIAVKADTKAVTLPTGHMIEMMRVYRENDPSYQITKWNGQHLVSFRLRISKPVPGAIEALAEDLPEPFGKGPICETMYCNLKVENKPIDDDWSAVISEFAALLSEVDDDVQSHVEEIAQRRQLKAEGEAELSKGDPEPASDMQADDTRIVHFQSWVPEDAARATREISDLRKQGFVFFAAGDGYVILTRDDDPGEPITGIPTRQLVLESNEGFDDAPELDEDTDLDPAVWGEIVEHIETATLADRLVEQGEFSNAVKSLTNYIFHRALRDPAFQSQRQLLSDAKSLMCVAADLLQRQAVR